MRFEPVEKIDKQGRRVLLRSPELSDAPALIDYLKTTSGETPFLLREPDEISMTPELEGKFLQGRLDAERECMVLAEVEKDISEMLKEAANVYETSDIALRLRTMHLLYESVKSSGGTVVIPSAYSEGFNDQPLENLVKPGK